MNFNIHLQNTYMYVLELNCVVIQNLSNYKILQNMIFLFSLLKQFLKRLSASTHFNVDKHSRLNGLNHDVLTVKQ